MTADRHDVRTIPIATIEEGARLRPVDERRVGLLAESMEQTGQQNPVICNYPDQMRVPDFPDRVVLVAGAHRLAAARMLGWTQIAARLVALSADQARLMEIDENLARHELSQLDRCLALAEREALWLHMHPRARRGAGRPPKDEAIENTEEKNSVMHDRISGFRVESAEAAGISERHLRKVLQIARKLDPEAAALLRTTGAADKFSALYSICCMAPELQIAAARKLRAGEAKTLSGALWGRERNGRQDLKILERAWDRANRADKRRFVKAHRDEIKGLLKGGDKFA